MMVSLRLASGLIIMATTGDSSSRVHRALAVALRLGTHNPRARARARWEWECPSTGVEDRCKRVELLRHRLASLRCHGERCPSQHLFPSRLQSQRIATRQGTQLLTGALVRLQDQVHPSREGGRPSREGGHQNRPLLTAAVVQVVVTRAVGTGWCQRHRQGQGLARWWNRRKTSQ